MAWSASRRRQRSIDISLFADGRYPTCGRCARNGPAAEAFVLVAPETFTAYFIYLSGNVLSHAAHAVEQKSGIICCLADEATVHIATRRCKAARYPVPLTPTLPPGQFSLTAAALHTQRPHALLLQHAQLRARDLRALRVSRHHRDLSIHCGSAISVCSIPVYAMQNADADAGRAEKINAPRDRTGARAGILGGAPEQRLGELAGRPS